ncbi:HXXEE domain-containing protein [Streptomyces sp. NPDC050504]|uniref:HXXEE domain-containing protein n=1 Tax=Streptomyces sp. NPDC050504 TaxID=3365618 RepID=UPI0037B16D6F
MGPAVTWGLFAAWAVHDAEELATMARWIERARPGLQERFPRVPAAVWERTEISQREVNVAIGAMAGVFAAASAAGARTGGRSRFFRTVLVGFGLHGAVHLAQAALYRGYTPGVLTSPTVVVPYALWAVRRLRAAGVEVETVRSAAGGLVYFPVAVAGVHALARRTRNVRRAGDPREAGHSAAAHRVSSAKSDSRSPRPGWMRSRSAGAS